MLITLDILGTLAFAITGASKAIQYKLDLLGLLVLAVVTGIGGGVLRDVLLATSPPLAFQQPIYVMVCFVAAFLTLTGRKWIHAHWNFILVVDALGLGFFTAVGASRACLVDAGFLAIVFSAVITAVGGGLFRDILVKEIPQILKRDFYATAALIGAVLFIVLHYFEVGTPTIRLLVTTFFTFIVRLFAMKFRFQLPKV